MRDLALKRHNDIKKAIRKKAICKHAYGWEYYDNLHQYSKNKIHCSCPMCASKTNDKVNKSKGPVADRKPGFCGRVPMTDKRLGKNWKVSDRRKIDSLNNRLKEYLFDKAV